jgi:enoyl-CoA hydratase
MMLKLEYPQAGVALIRHEAPETRNKLDVETRRDMVARLEQLDADDDIRVVVVAGTPKAFASGADISQMSEAGAVDMWRWHTGEAWDRIARFSKPLIAAVRGYALGAGCELAMHCDIIVAGRNAVFGQPEPKVGIIPGAGGTQRFTRAVGKFRANLYLMTARPLDSTTALEMGLVSCVVDDEAVEAEALDIAGDISALPPLSIRFVKESVKMADNAPLDQALHFERRSCQFLFGTEDKIEGMNAFLEKRTPSFKGR